MVAPCLFAVLAFLSAGISLWQWLAGRCFPLHRRTISPGFAPDVTLLKPLKGCDLETGRCLQSWLNQNYPGRMQVLFGVASADDPVGGLVRALIRAHPHREAQLVICPESLGPNAKVSTLAQLAKLAQHEIMVVSDADVLVPADFLANVVAPLQEKNTGLVTCLHSLANPANLAMDLEAIAINADFWSMVLQGKTIRPLDFALGAVMAVKFDALRKIGGFAALADYLADDYELGHRIAAAGFHIELCPLVAECWEAPTTWRQVWSHQLRWARTVRVCMPGGYFFSILGNATLWPLVWLAVNPTFESAAFSFLLVMARVVEALTLQRDLTCRNDHDPAWWLVPIKDLAGVVIWALAFLGGRVEWRGQHFRVRRGGRLERV